MNTKIKLAGLWITLMLLYIYCDIYSFHRTGYINEMIAGKIGPFEVSQGLLAAFGMLMIIPALMVSACLFLKASINKWVNIVAGILYALVNIGNLIGETWAYYWIYGIIELLITVLIIIVAFKWEKHMLKEEENQ
jgi:hypothetical protein